MALVTVNLIDTFDEWRIKTNSLGSNTGDLATLSTTDKSSIVAAINEIHTDDSDDMEHLLDDTTPQLGGHLDLNSKDITGTGNINITGSLTATSIAGTVTGVTQSALDNTTKLATTAYTDTAVAVSIAYTDTEIAQIDTVIGGVFTGTVSNIQVPNNAITSNMIGPGVIVAQDLASNSVDGTHIALGSDVAGDTMYYNGTDYVRLPKGTIGQIMIQGANAPEWTGSIDGTVTGVTQSSGDNSTNCLLYTSDADDE